MAVRAYSQCMNKQVRFFRVWTGADGQSTIERLDIPPRTREGLYGDIRLENDSVIAFFYFEDKAAHAVFTSGSLEHVPLLLEDGSVLKNNGSSS
jgi:hypothetical protein